MNQDNEIAAYVSGSTGYKGFPRVTHYLEGFNERLFIELIYFLLDNLEGYKKLYEVDV